MNNMILRDIDWQLFSKDVAKIEVSYKGQCAEYDTICPYSKVNDEFCDDFNSKKCDSIYLTVLNDSNFSEIISLDIECKQCENSLTVNASEINKEFTGTIVLTFFKYQVLSIDGMNKKILREIHE